MGKSVTIVSSSRTFAVANLRVQQASDGTLEIVYTVANSANLILVSRIGNRFYLRNGIHRAFLLAGMGVKELLCLVVNDNQVPTLIGGYPAFAPAVLTQLRPPMLMDFFSEQLALTAPIQRMNKIVRVSVQDFLVPVD